MLFLSPSFPVIPAEAPVEPQGEFHYYGKIQQSDIVPTISSFLGWPIPKNNLGVLVQSFLGLWKGISLEIRLR
jgi:ethanolaminephosphotransferase